MATPFKTDRGQYYILPDIWAKGGGLRVASTGNETCPLTVVQSPSEVDNGFPVKISSPVRIQIIKTNFKVELSFMAVPICTSSAKWTVVKGEDETNSVKITGYDNTLTGWFKIQKYSDVRYKLVFCIEDDFCGDVGISRDDNGNRRLVIVDDDPYVVVFANAQSYDAAA